MGQYFMVINADKKEKINSYKLGAGMKLMEWSLNRSNVVLALINKLATDWKDDRVYVVGDYAEADNPDEKCYSALKRLEEEFGINSIYSYADENFEDISSKCDITDHGYRYIYNHASRQVIDLTKCPVEWAWYDVEAGEGAVSSISPLPILLAMGNGRGGGDYYSGYHSAEYVGSWCDTSEYIEVSKDLIPGNEYTWFAPDFSEQPKIIPYTEGPGMVEKVKCGNLKRYGR